MSGQEIAPEVVQRMVAFVRELDAYVRRHKIQTPPEIIERALEIAALLPEPVDPDILEAKKCVEEWCLDADDSTVTVIAWAIKRGRQLAEPRP